jgi:hypothetical protein
VVEQDNFIVSPGQPFKSLRDITGQVNLAPGEFLLKPGAARLIIFDNQNAGHTQLRSQESESRRKENQNKIKAASALSSGF